ncbi:hypothetical protein PC9H_006155 [Pleurotus ostreatus]|uniref:Uncharacterized protein n=1 Tax=Pleurotus ostreatus TaxID=5322 RepID=A0A8H6ZVP0_PLEOS|nr:uncharacterized protein PC9H_006155 [Pleurotus ostreatus]KAF7430448.1 hypothetical protein PC9H_006155 [Pleurotus ostreatus]
MSDEDRSPRKVATIPTTIRRRMLTPKTTSTSERIPAFPIQPLGAPSTMPARTHRTEAAKKVGPRYHAPPGSSRPATDFRSSGNPFSSDKPWVAKRQLAQGDLLIHWQLARKLMTRPGGRPPRIVPGVGLKAARKTAAGTHFSTDDDDDIIELDSDDASQSDWSTSSDDTDQLDPEEYAPSDPSTSTAPPKELLEAFNKLTFHTRRMQQVKCLPFLRRNFRRGFLSRCRKEGRHTDADPKGNDEFSLEVVYRLDEGHLQYTVKGLAHLEWDHTAVLAHWVDMATCWRVTITLTSNANIEEMEGLSLEDIPLEPSVSDEAEASAVVAPLEGVALPPSIAPETPSVVQALDETQLSVPYVNVSSVPLLPPPTSPLAEPLIVLPPSPAPSARLRSLSPQLPPPSSPATNISDPVAAHPDASAAAPPHEVEPKTPLPAAIDLPEIPLPASTQPPQAACPPSSRPPNLPARCPTPPPKENPLGPAARYPYLPYVSEYGGPTMFYSCRPGGPRLYDLLGTLPMEPFGLMAWYILDIEEEMFDEDHIADELKVVLALWGRWIFLHRMEFLANYYQGVIMFVDEYWRMIHRAAGWEALRWHLVILKASKFLTFIDIAKILKHYEYLVGMEYWET